MRVFITYASEDRPIAESIAYSLRGRGHQVFFDRTDLPPGQTYEEQIETAIGRSDVVVFVITPASVEPGRFTLTELGLVQRRWPHPAGRVLPVVAASTELAAIPGYLRAVTLLEPAGNVAAETAVAVEHMRRRFRWPMAAALSGAVGITAVALFVIQSNFGFSPESRPQPKPCLLSGVVFNRVTNEPLANVIIGLDRWTENVRDSEQVAYNAAVTGIDGSFTLECRNIQGSEFPLRIVLRHTNWRATHLTNERIDYRDVRSGVNLPVAISRNDLRCPPIENVPAVASGPVGDIVTIGTPEGSKAYDFSAGRESTDLHAGDFYFSGGICPQFWANNRGQRGLIDLGDIGVSLDEVRPPPPRAGYDTQGVRAFVGHTYVALPKEGRAGFIVFRLLDLEIEDNQAHAYTIQYLLLTE